MIELSNGMKFEKASKLRTFILGLKFARRRVNYPAWSYAISHSAGQRYAKSVAIAAIDAAIENAELALKSAQQKETKMKAAKKPAAKPVAKKPALKTSATKKKPTKKC